MKTLYESILSKTSDKIGDVKKTMNVIAHLPKPRDWEKAGTTYRLKWDMSHLMNKYGQDYPYLKDYTHIVFYKLKGTSVILINLVKDGDLRQVYHQTACYGQVDWNTKITEVKNLVYEFLKKISENPKEFEKFLFALDKDKQIDVFSELW